MNNLYLPFLQTGVKCEGKLIPPQKLLLIPLFKNKRINQDMSACLPYLYHLKRTQASMACHHTVLRTFSGSLSHWRQKAYLENADLNARADKEIMMYVDIYVCVCVCVHSYIHTIQFYLTIKNEAILLFLITWMDLEGIMVSEISQTEKDKYYMISMMCRTKKTHKKWDQPCGY